jgi:hypothetical protein
VSQPNVSESRSSGTPPKPNKLIASLIFRGLILVLLLAVISFAVISMEGLLEDDHTPLLEMGVLAGAAGLSYSFALLSVIRLGTLLTGMSFEYLRGRIGEKRPGQWIAIRQEGTSNIRFSSAALFKGRAVFLRDLFQTGLCEQTRFSSSFEIDSSVSWKEKLLIQGGR